MDKKIYTCTMGGREIIVETGHLAEQAGGAITIREGDTHVFVTATMSSTPRDVDFLPLSVDFEERLYAVGRIPGSFFRREGRPPVSAILIARLTDRPLRPLFPKTLRNEVQIIEMPLSVDDIHQPDILAVCGASAALHISNIPWEGPIGAVRVGLIDGEFVLNPTYLQMADTKLDLRMAATADAILMVECAANEVDEATMIDALRFGHEGMQPFIALQEQMRAEVGKEKLVVEMPEADDDLSNQVSTRVMEPIAEIVRTKYDRDERNAALDDLREAVIAEYEPSEEDEADEVVDYKQIRKAFADVIKSQVREQILNDNLRPDGRGLTDIRELSASVGFTPRAHGSGVFKRGQTQVLSILTLGTPRDAQELDGIDPIDTTKRYLHHYNFPPYSTGETWFMRGPKRREIGHGMLAENALRPVLPDSIDFPYTLRVVSEVMSSNGSTSMASVCGSTLAMLDGGVPLKASVAGIAMGLITDGERHAVLTDIQGLEDHLGDMDFKVAGTRAGITALQMDIKIKGLSDQVMAQALQQALDARLQILEVMESAISEPGELSNYAPRIEKIKIDPEKIGAIIGKGGETIRGIQEKTGARIDIEEDGTVYIATADGAGMREAIDTIEGLTLGAELGAIYTGKVTRVENYGAFVEILPGTDGLVHISQLDTYRVKSVEDIVNVGDEIMVMVTDESNGKIRLSRQAVLEGWTLEEAQANDGGRKSGGGGRRGGNRGGGGGRGGNRN